MIGQTVGHYRIDSKLGEGGMGVVYRAFDTHLDRAVAIKVLRPDAAPSPERRRRFVLEAKSASALNHPNIIHIYDIDTANLPGGPTDFIAMEFVPAKRSTNASAKRG
jgi:Serine/threonine protein kinase